MPTMPEPKEHSIKRVRKAFKDLPEISGMRWLSGARQFAAWVGCSESLIRNVETGAAKFSQKLAKMIEAKTGVSAEWLLGGSEASDPIRDVRGEDWSPKWIDVFSAHPDLGLLYRICPGLLPRVIAKLVEADLMTDFSGGRRAGSVTILQRLFRKDAFNNEDFKDHLRNAIEQDSSFSGRYGLCLSRALDDSRKSTPEREAELVLLTQLGIEHMLSHALTAKLADKKFEPRE